MHRRADPVAHVLTDDREAGRLGHLLHGPADVVQAVALLELGDPGPEAALGHLDEARRLGRDLADGHVKAASPW